MYVITDGERYIFKDHNNKYVPTYGITLAEKFTRKQAEGILSSSLPKALRSVFRVEKIAEDCEVNVKPVSEQDIDNTEKVSMSEDIRKWLSKVTGLNGLARDASSRKMLLTSQLSDVDKELCDLLHYCEFCNLNAAQGYKAYKMIKERRIRRRTIKNELTVLNIILGKKIGESVADEITQSVLSMDNRQYTPRVLKELFDT